MSPLNKMDDDCGRLAECAKWFRHNAPPERLVPERFETDQDALECMKNVLLFEAHHAMQEAQPVPVAPISNAVDLASDQPGIARTVSGKVVLQRTDAIVRPVMYDVGGALPEQASARDESATPPKLPASRLKKMMESSERNAWRAHERAEARAADSFLSKEELKEKRKVAREKREQARAEKQGLDGPEGSAEKTKETTKKTEKNEKKTTAALQQDCVETLERVAPMGEEVKPPKRLKKADANDPEFYASPAPHDRYLQALEASALHSNIRGTILNGEPADNPHVTITHGPPGCGKSHALLDALAAYHEQNPNARCLITGPTNVTAADLYKRAFAKGMVGCLALSKENMPPGVPRPRAIDIRSARFVFCTVAGRAGPRLHAERFNAVFLDEAGLCPESIVWGLLRPEVTYMWMVGDLQQLSAITSVSGVALQHQRSIMERLVLLGVRTHTLTVQRRMHPEICDYPSRAFYDGSLVTQQVGPSVVEGVAPYTLIHVAGTARRMGTSFENQYEAERVLEIARQLKAHYANTVILTPYAAQLQRIRAAQSGIMAFTVDSYQGKEADAVVLSLVRTPESGAGFWAEEKRLNVALTRAKHAMRVVGSLDGWNPSDAIAKLAEDARRRELLL